MPSDKPLYPPVTADGSQDNVQAAAAWLNTDTTTTRQRIPYRHSTTTAGALLREALGDLEFDRLLGKAGHERHWAQEDERALTEAQATWLIRRLPARHQPPSVDSAQQAGRAWGVLIAPGTVTLPTREALTAVAAHTGISAGAAEEIIAQARLTGAAYTRADRLAPYDDAPAEVLRADWSRLAACGRELPEASARAQDVLELLAARTMDPRSYDWMRPEAQQVAQWCEIVAQVQPMLSPLAELVPGRKDHAASLGEERLRLYRHNGALVTVMAEAARAQAVVDWSKRTTSPGQARHAALESAAPRMRSLRSLHSALTALDPAYGRFPEAGIDYQRVTEVVQAIRRLITAVGESISQDPTALLPPSTPNERHRTSVDPRHLPPETGQGGGGPRPSGPAR